MLGSRGGPWEGADIPLGGSTWPQKSLLERSDPKLLTPAANTAKSRLMNLASDRTGENDRNQKTDPRARMGMHVVDQ